MAWEQPCFKPSGLVSSGDLSAKQYYLVKIHTVAGQVAESTVLGEVVIGALQNKPTSGQAAEVMQSGITPLVASAAISAGDKLMAAGTTGKVATANADNQLSLDGAAQGHVMECMLREQERRWISVFFKDGVWATYVTGVDSA